MNKHELGICALARKSLKNKNVNKYHIYFYFLLFIYFIYIHIYFYFLLNAFFGWHLQIAININGRSP